MSEAVTVTPAAVVLVSGVPRRQPFPERAEIKDQPRFVLNGGDPGGGPRNEYRDVAFLDSRFTHRQRHVRGDVDHVPVTQLRRRVSYLHQSPVLVKASVGENLRLPFRLRAAERKEAPGDAELKEWLERYLLSDVSLEDSAGNCSVSQKQRLCLIRALLLNPEVLAHRKRFLEDHWRHHGRSD